MDDWRWKSAADLGRAIGRGEVDPVALTTTFLDAIRRDDPDGRIYARTTEARALAEAGGAAARARAGQRLSLLDGVPLSWKDLFDTAGTATEAGSRLLAGRVPAADAQVLKNATAQGLVCLGKTHMTELAFSGLGVNPMTATPPNVNDPALAPGGSSSGAAASVAFGLAPAAIGSDTAGSVRIPATWNDLVGLKTTSGRLPLRGVVPLRESFDTIGPLARTVEDAALLLAVLEGSRATDLRGATLRGARLFVLENVVHDDIRPAPLAGFNLAIDRLQDAGATIERGAVPEVAEALSMSAVLDTTESYATWRDVIEAAPEVMFPPILDRFRAGKAHSGADFAAAWRRLRAIREIWADRTAGYDAVLVPSVPSMPPNVARLLADRDHFASENLFALRNSRVGNLLGLSALTLPTGIPMTGITLLGAPMAEERLLRLGAAAEAALR